ncbi:FkbM family methyltransferase [Fredinandcohnia humi]
MNKADIFNIGNKLEVISSLIKSFNMDNKIANQYEYLNQLDHNISTIIKDTNEFFMKVPQNLFHFLCNKVKNEINYYKQHLKSTYDFYQIENDITKLQIILENLKLSEVAQKSHSMKLNSIGQKYINEKNYINAEISFRELLLYDTNALNTYNNLGVSLQRQGKYLEAIECFYLAMQHGNNAQLFYNIGITFNMLKKFDDARFFLKRALELDSSLINIFVDLGVTYENENNLEVAELLFKKAIEKDGRNYLAYYNLAYLYGRRGHLDQAEVYYIKAIKINPNHFDSVNNLAVTLQNNGKYKKALTNYLEALKIRPGSETVYNNLGSLYRILGDIEKSIDYYQKSININNNPIAYSNYLFTLNYHNGFTPQEIYNKHLQFGQVFENNDIKYEKHYDYDHKKRIKVGYIGADFKQHSVAYFIEPILKSHDVNKFDIYIYSNVEKPDHVSKRISQYAGHWRNIYKLDDEEIIKVIKLDKIDILVDLSGHTAGNKLLVLSKKPAPIQVSWMGYPNTTGLKEIDYRITDSISDPEGITDSLYTEKLIRMSKCFLTYLPTNNSPELKKDLPYKENGFITFGSFNAFPKINEETISIWSDILKSIPSSKLYIKTKGIEDEETRDSLIKRFEKYNISNERLILSGYKLDNNDHLSSYNEVDIALDTFPYNGTTTTFEAIWMGVPVVTLSGSTHVSRVGSSILKNLDLDELISNNPVEYIDNAVKLAINTKKLADLRKSLRNRLLNSPLCNYSSFTRELEQKYREMWIHFCEKNSFVELPISSVKKNKDNVSELKLTEEKPLKKLHIGGVEKKDGWEILNALDEDYVDYLGDARNLQQFTDNTFDIIYASHVVEHFDYKDMVKILKDWYRVLTPGGKIFISVPNFEVLAELFLDKVNLNLSERFHVMRMVFGGHINDYDYHFVGLDKEILSDFLKQAGFVNISEVDEFGLFNDTSNLVFKGRKISLNLIAEKPNATQKLEGFEISDFNQTGPLKIIDIGAMDIGSKDLWNEMCIKGEAVIYGFEPIKEECEKLNKNSSSSRIYFPHLVGDGEEKDFYITNTGMTSSIYEPNSEFLNKYQNLNELTKVVNKERIKTVRLDDIVELNNGVDFIKVDAQGAEYEIFSNAKNILKETMVIQTETIFTPMYKNQPLFAEIDQLLRENGFMFHKFLGLAGRTLKPLIVNQNPNMSMSQTLWSDAIYIKDLTKLNKFHPNKLLKMAYIMHEIYASYDLVHYILEIYDQKVNSRKAPNYLNHLMK